MTAGIDREYECSFAQSATSGFRAGKAKLLLAYRLGLLLVKPQTAESLHSNIHKISKLAQKIDDLKEDLNSLRGSFRKAAKRISGNIVSFTTEN